MVDHTPNATKDSDQDSAGKQNSATTDLTAQYNTEMSFRSLDNAATEGEPSRQQQQQQKHEEEQQQQIRESSSTEHLTKGIPSSDSDVRGSLSLRPNSFITNYCGCLPESLQEILQGILESIRRFRTVCGVLVNHPYAQVIVVVLIIVNAIILGVATFDFVTDNDAVADVFSKVDKAFLVCFTVELALQLVYHGHKFFLDGWLFFDFAIVILSWSLDSLSVLRAFRVMRTIRLVTRLKTLKNLLNAIFEVGPSVTATMMMLLLIMYIYAVLCTELFGDMYEKGQLDDNYFGRLDNSLFTLLELSTMEWANIVRQVVEVHGWKASLIFTSFLVMTGFILYSLVVAIICDAVADQEHQEETEKKRKEEVESRQRLTRLRETVQELTKKQKDAMESIQSALSQLDDLTKKDEDTLRRSKSHDAVFSLSFWEKNGKDKHRGLVETETQHTTESIHST